jgi:N6-adenosine-specific RNA methylase IME4
VKVNTTALSIPQPQHVVPRDFADKVKAWTEIQDKLEHLRETDRKLAALIGYLGDREQRAQVEAARRWVEVRIGQLLGRVEIGQRTDLEPSPVGEGLDKHERHEFRKLAEHADVVERTIASGNVSRAAVLGAIKLSEIESRATEPTAGVYDAIVIDPPWPMQKIEREVRPNQALFDYPTMNEEELSRLEIPTADDCHVWTWTTAKFLPMALRLIDAWGLKYVCPFVWHKPGGFQPVGLPQYNCEFALYARRGSPVFADTKAFSLCFDAPRGAHSEKPEAFYDTVRRATVGRRLDMFGRRIIDGFESWGNEVAR